MSDTREPIGHANNNGDVRNTFDFETFLGHKGPNYMGEVMFPVTAEYDPETNKTKVGFSLLPPVQMELIE